MALSRDTVVAEFYRHADRQGMPAENLLPRRFQEYDVQLSRVLDLREEQVRADLGLTDAIIRSDDPSRCQLVGDAAHYAGFEGILAPSATGTGEVLAVFTDTLVAGSSIEVGDSDVWYAPPDATE
jgi:RES domain-containing protein